jgi:hypothetical protein
MELPGDMAPPLDFDIGGDPSPANASDGSELRQPPSPSDSRLNAATMGWMRQLPPEIAPVELALRYPRILNRLARYWDVPRMIREYFEDLLFTKRTKRKGFAPPVKAEIIALCNYYQHLHPAKSLDLWDDVPVRGRNGAPALHR